MLHCRVSPGWLETLEGLVPLAKFRKAPLEHDDSERSTDTKIHCQQLRNRRAKALADAPKSVLRSRDPRD
jgi:hypothetical protein